MSLNRQTVLQGFPSCQLTDVYQQEAASAGSGRDSASAAADIVSGSKYWLATSGELVEVQDSTSRISVPYSWQQQEYQPPTVVNVRIVEDQSSPTSCTSSTSVRRPHQQHDGDICRMSNTVSHLQMPHPVLQFDSHSQLQRTATCQSAVGRQTESVPVLQKFNEELVQQQMSWKTGSPLSSMQAYADCLKQSVIKPVPVKAQQALSQLNAKSGQSPVSCNSDAWNPYLSVGISQSAQFSSPGPLSVGRRHPAPGNESRHSPTRYSFGLASDAQHVTVPAWSTAMGSPVQHYRPQQHGIRSPVNYSSPIPSSLPPQSPQSRVLSHDVQVARHILSKQQRSGIHSPLMSFSPPRCQVGYGTLHGAVRSPTMSVAAVQVNQQMPSTALLSQHCRSTISPTTLSGAVRPTSCQSSGVGSEVGFAALCSVPRSATGLRHYRMVEPAMSVLPPLPNPLRHGRLHHSVVSQTSCGSWD